MVELKIPTWEEAPKGLLWMFQRIISAKTPERCKATLALLAGGTLCVGFLLLIAAVWYQAICTKAGRVDEGLVWALTGVSAFLAIMATFSYLKTEAQLPLDGGK